MKERYVQHHRPKIEGKFLRRAKLKIRRSRNRMDVEDEEMVQKGTMYISE